MIKKVTRVRTDVKRGVTIVTAFGPSVKGRKRIVGQLKKKDGKPSEMLADLLEKILDEG